MKEVAVNQHHYDHRLVLARYSAAPLGGILHASTAVQSICKFELEKGEREVPLTISGLDLPRYILGIVHGFRGELLGPKGLAGREPRAVIVYHLGPLVPGLAHKTLRHGGVLVGARQEGEAAILQRGILQSVPEAHG